MNIFPVVFEVPIKIVMRVEVLQAWTLVDELDFGCSSLDVRHMLWCGDVH